MTEKIEKKARQFIIEDLVAEAKVNSKTWFQNETEIENIVDIKEENLQIVDDNVSDDEDDADINLYDKLPKSDFITLEQGNKTITALDFDRSGNRLVTGSIDYEVKMWDFSGMDDNFESYRSLEPCGNNLITSLSFNCTGDNILVTSGSGSGYVMDRDGHEVIECIKGDQYIIDTMRTMGHQAAIHEGCWHPRTKKEFLTCSADCTMRIWDVETADKKHKDIVKIKTKNGSKAIPTSCTFDKQHGNLVACISQDGSIQMWDVRKRLVNAVLVVRDGHPFGTDGTLTISYDNNYIATRAMDDTLKLWDVRLIKSANVKSVSHPVHAWTHLYNRFSMTNASFSPNDKYICTLTSDDPRHNLTGKLVFVSRDEPQTDKPIETSTIVEEMELSTLFNKLDPSLNKASKFDSEKKRAESRTLIGGVRVSWHPRINQIAIGCTDGRIRVFYDPELSHKGALNCASIHRTIRQDIFKDNKPFIIVPEALPMFKENTWKNSIVAQMKARRDPVKSHKPELPLEESGVGGRISEVGGTLHAFVVKNIALAKPIDDKQDPREAILKFAKVASENQYWTKAYKKNQPHAIFNEEDELEEFPPRLPKEDKRLKLF